MLSRPETRFRAVSWDFCCGIGSPAGTISKVLLSLVYRLLRCLFGLLAVLTRLICPRRLTSPPVPLVNAF
jgi:hypothetical protein